MTLPNTPGAPHTVQFRVRYAETDQMGIVHHASYVVWCEFGRTEYIRDLGMSYAELERSGVSLAVAELSMRYHSPARYDDMVSVTTTLTSVRSRAITFDYLIADVATGERLVTARTQLVSVDPDGRPASLPQEVRAMFETAAAPEVSR